MTMEADILRARIDELETWVNRLQNRIVDLEAIADDERIGEVTFWIDQFQDRIVDLRAQGKDDAK